MKVRRNKKREEIEIDDETLSDLDECFRTDEADDNDDENNDEIILAYSKVVLPYIRDNKKPFSLK